MGFVKFTSWNDKKILEGNVDVVLDEMGVSYSQVADDNIASPIWQWDDVTLRFQSLLMGGKPNSGGGVYVQPGLRDIVDTGSLRASMTTPQLSANSGKRAMKIAWTAKHANKVRFGLHHPQYTGPDGRTYNPNFPKPYGARDWIAKSLEDAPALPMFTAIWNSFTHVK